MIYEIIHSIISCVGAVTILTLMSLSIDKTHKLKLISKNIK